MSFKKVIFPLSFIAFAYFSAFAQSGQSDAMKQKGQIFTLKQQNFITCSKEKLYALHDFLDPAKPAEQKDFKPSFCGEVKKAIKSPAWLEKILPAMEENRLWEMPKANGDKEYLSEADMWKRPLTDLSHLLKLAQEIDNGSTYATNGFMEDFSLARINLILDVERLKTNPRLIGYDMRDSLEGRGRSVLATLEMALKEADSMAESFVSSNWKSKFKKSSLALAILSNSIYGEIVNHKAPILPYHEKIKRESYDLIIVVLMSIGTLLVFFATYKFIEAKDAQISRLVGEYLQKSTTWAEDYSRQFLDINVKYIVLGTLAVFCLFGLFFALAAGGFFGIFMFFVFFGLGLAIGLKMPGIILDSLKRKRGEKINKQLMDALILMSNALKSGMDIVQGFEMVSTDLRPPISDEFGLVIKNYKLGTPFEKSLENMEERVESRLLSYMVKAIVLQRQVGGNLTKIFERIVENIREESKLEEKLQAMTAQQRIQSLVVAIMPWLMVGVLFIFQPQLMIKFYTSVPGLIVLFVCIVWISIGMKMVRKMGEIKV